MMTYQDARNIINGFKNTFQACERFEEILTLAAGAEYAAKESETKMHECRAAITRETQAAKEEKAALQRDIEELHAQRADAQAALAEMRATTAAEAEKLNSEVADLTETRDALKAAIAALKETAASVNV